MSFRKRNLISSLTPGKREDLYNSIEMMIRNARKMTLIQLLETFCNIADSVALDNDFSRLTSQVEKKALLSFLKIKIKAFAELENQANSNKYPDWNETGCYARYFKPLLHYTIAHYMLWCLGQPKSNSTQLLFWLFKATKLFFKISFAVLVYLGLKEAIEFIAKKENCISAGRIWSFINAINDYDCTVCGDLPVFYRYSKTFTDCLTNYLQVPRTANQIIALLKRVQPADEVALLDFTNQVFTDPNNETALEIVLNAVNQYLPNLAQLNFGPNNENNSFPCQAPIIGSSTANLLAIVNYLNQAKLKILNLDCQQIGDQGMRILTPALCRSQLSELDLEYNALTSNSTPMLGSVLSYSSLRRLDLWGNNIDDNGIKILAAALSKSSLEMLALSYNPLSDIGAQALALILQNITTLHELYLQNTFISDMGTQAVAMALPSSHLFALDLWNNKDINTASLQVLGSNILHSSLQELTVSINSTDADIAQSLSSLLSQSTLKAFAIGDNAISDLSVQALASYLPYSTLQKLALQTNSISQGGLQILFSTLLNSSELQIFRLIGNIVDNMNVKILAAILPHTLLQELRLNQSFIGDDGVQLLASTLPHSLVSLSLPYNNISDDGLQALASTLPQSNLRHLALTHNLIGNLGAIILAQNLIKRSQLPHPLWINFLYSHDRPKSMRPEPNTALNFLDLSFNQINDSGARALCSALPWTNIPIANFYLYGNPIDKTIIDENGFCVYSAASSLRPSIVFRFLYHFFQLPQHAFLYLQEYLSHIPITSLLCLSISNNLTSFNLPILLSDRVPLLNYTHNKLSPLESSLENPTPTNNVSNDAMIITLIIILFGSILYQLFQKVVQTTQTTDLLIPKTKYEISLATQTPTTKSNLNFLTKCWQDRSNLRSSIINQASVSTSVNPLQVDILDKGNHFCIH